MKVVFIGTVKFSYSTLEHLLQEDFEDVEIVGIVTRIDSNFNSDFKSLKPLAIKYRIPVFIAEGINQNSMSIWIKNLNPDVIYCFGWSYLLKNEILNIPSIGVIGYHPAVLPENRGRHPIIWSLALGLSKTASTFFFMDLEADSGDILSQRFLEINDTDDAMTLYNKLIKVALIQISEFTQQLTKNEYKRITQDHLKANYWRKRSKNDGEIDWRMSAKSIYNLIRALTKPYIGAHCCYKEEEIKIWKAELVNGDFLNIEPGKVLKVEGKDITIKCGEGLIKLIEHEFKCIPVEGSYL